MGEGLVPHVLLVVAIFTELSLSPLWGAAVGRAPTILLWLTNG